MTDAKSSNSFDPVRHHVRQIVDDLSNGRVTPKQRSEIGKALQDAAVRSITRSVGGASESGADPAPDYVSPRRLRRDHS